MSIERVPSKPTPKSLERREPIPTLEELTLMNELNAEEASRLSWQFQQFLEQWRALDRTGLTDLDEAKYADILRELEANTQSAVLAEERSRNRVKGLKDLS